MSLFKRDLKKCGKPIEIANRKMTMRHGQPSETFTVTNTVTGIIKTISGVSVFDDTNTERVATHGVTIEYLPEFTSEKWLKLESGKRLKILTVENFLERNECLLLMCTERGLDSKVVNDA